ALDVPSQRAARATEAHGLDLKGRAVSDDDGFYGVVRFSGAARDLGLPTIFGAELSLDLPGPQNGEPDPAGRHLLVLARGPEGYSRLSRVISLAQLAGGEKGRPVYDLDEVAKTLAGHVLVLTGCRKGHVPAALREGGTAAAAPELARLATLFGGASVAGELTQHGYPDDDERSDGLAELARRYALPTVATGIVHGAAPRRLTEQGARRRYGTRAARPDAYRQLDHELDMIEKLGFPGYFLIVHDIVEFCRGENIYCQGRGSAANSAVCYALGITNVDAV